MLYIIAEAAVGDDISPAFFFGYMGVAAALTFCSNKFSMIFNGLIKFRSWICLRNSEEWCGYLVNGCVEARTYHQIMPSNYYGWYLGFVRSYHISHPVTKKYVIQFDFSLHILFCCLVKNDGKYSYYLGYQHLAAGLCCGLSSLSAGLAIGITGDAGVRANAQQDKVYVGMLLMQIFAEAIGLFGLIVAIILTSSS